MPLLCSRLLAQMPRVEERLLSPWGGSFWSSSPSVAGSKGVLFGLFRGLWGRRPSRLLAQMPNSQGGSDAASLYSYFYPPGLRGPLGIVHNPRPFIKGIATIPSLAIT